MVDRMRKTLERIPPKQRAILLGVLRRVTADDVVGLDVKKLQGRDDIYRVRKGVFRIIFRKISDKENVIIAIERRSDTTYHEFS